MTAGSLLCSGRCCGQITALYPEKLIFDIAGFPAVRGKDLVENLKARSGGTAPSACIVVVDEQNTVSSVRCG